MQYEPLCKRTESGSFLHASVPLLESAKAFCCSLACKFSTSSGHPNAYCTGSRQHISSSMDLHVNCPVVHAGHNVGPESNGRCGIDDSTVWRTPVQRTSISQAAGIHVPALTRRISFSLISSRASLSVDFSLSLSKKLLFRRSFSLIVVFLASPVNSTVSLEDLPGFQMTGPSKYDRPLAASAAAKKPPTTQKLVLLRVTLRLSMLS